MKVSLTILLLSPSSLFCSFFHGVGFSVPITMVSNTNPPDPPPDPYMQPLHTSISSQHSLGSSFVVVPDDLSESLDACNMHQDDDDLPLLMATEDEKILWEKMLFCKVFANYFQDDNILGAELRKIWSVDDDFTVKHIKNGIFMMNITNQALSDFVLLNSPWCVKGVCMGIRKL